MFNTLRENVDSRIPIIELDHNINDREFALAAAKKLIELMNG